MKYIQNHFLRGAISGVLLYILALSYLFYERNNNLHKARTLSMFNKSNYEESKKNLLTFIGDDNYRKSIYNEVFTEDCTQTKYALKTSVMGIERIDIIESPAPSYMDAIAMLIQTRESNYWVIENTKKLLLNEIGYSTQEFIDQLLYSHDTEEPCNHYFPRFKKLLEKSESEKKEILSRIATSIYGNSSLSTGSMPWSYCYGSLNSCGGWGCSDIFVRAGDSDVIITIKDSNDEVVRHAYIKSNDSFTFHLPNGIYTSFFYYGRGWNPNRLLKKNECGPIRGGFIADEQVEKDMFVPLLNNILSYTLVKSAGGTLHTNTSSTNEAL